MSDLYSSFPYLQRVQAHERWLAQQDREVSELRYKLRPFRHTNPNAKRKTVSTRRGFVWKGSWTNFESRLKNRWPIRYFFTYTSRRKIWWPITRLPRMVKELFVPRVNGHEKMFNAELVRLFGSNPKTHELADKIMAVEGADPNLLYRIIDAHLAVKEVRSLNKKIRKLELELEPRIGFPGLTIVDYPEGVRIKSLHAHRETLYANIKQTTTELSQLNH